MNVRLDDTGFNFFLNVPDAVSQAGQTLSSLKKDVLDVSDNFHSILFLNVVHSLLGY